MYSVVYEKSAIKGLLSVEKPFRLLIKEKIEILAKDPDRLKNRVKALKGKEYKGLYRLRVGDYCVVYQRKDDVLIILIVRIGHRKEVY